MVSDRLNELKFIVSHRKGRTRAEIETSDGDNWDPALRSGHPQYAALPTALDTLLDCYKVEHGTNATDPAVGDGK